VVDGRRLRVGNDLCHCDTLAAELAGSTVTLRYLSQRVTLGRYAQLQRASSALIEASALASSQAAAIALQSTVLQW